MNYLVIVLAFLSFTTVAFFIQQHLGENLKRYSFLCSLSVISLFLYYSTFGMNYFYAQYLIYLFSAGVILHDGLKHKFANLKKFTQVNRGFFILSLVWFILTIFARIQQWDDFSWAIFVKHINQFGTYWNSKSAILSVGFMYFPGISLWENFFTGHRIYSEQSLFFAVGLIVISTFHACIPSDLKSKKWFYFFVLFMAPISWFTPGIGNISSEVMMGMLLAAGIFSALDIENPEDLFVPFVIACFLAITKETGFLLALLVVLLMAIRVLREKLYATKWMAWTIACLLIMILNFILWQRYLALDNAPVAFNIKSLLSFMTQDLNQVSPKSETILKSFFQASYERMMGRSYLTRIPYLGFIKGSYILWIAIMSALFFTIRKTPEYLITFLWGLIGYSSVILVNFLYVFSDYEGFSLASYERYMGLYCLAFLIVGLKVIYKEKLYQNKKFLYVLVGFIVIFPPSPRVLYPPSIRYKLAFLVPEKYQAKLDKDMRLGLEPIRAKIISDTPEDAKIWFIWQCSNGLEAMVMRYEITPRKMNDTGWSLGERCHPIQDVWSSNISVEEFTGHVGQYDYVAMGEVDEHFNKRYGSLFNSPPRTGYVYKKETTNGVTRWTEL